MDKPRARRDTCRLTVTIRGEEYHATPLEPEADDVVKAWRLRKASGDAYVVADTADGATCECRDYVYRHEGRDQVGCKHIRSLRALGLLDREDGGPESWPAWTDTHAFTNRTR
jgi:hypothetical protein